MIGGAGNDAIAFGTAAVNGSMDLGAGSDTLALAGYTNRVSVTNVETVQGGSGSDTIVLCGSVASTVLGGGGMNFITGNTGADQFVLDQSSHASCTWLMNFSSAKGDRIALDTAGNATLSANTYDLGGAALVVNTDLAAAADAASRFAITLNNGGKGAFVYQQDTGELFYSGNGSFAAGGSLISVITSDGVTPWAFNANSFMQV